ncbi:hypothetical protein [Teichococcus aestuarii]|uniref:hypothetical protein n=1 Tax=Teichococcus aestuarii TaxID=568898 RepID=UPI0011B2929F|nr:hypothetical protein [Pseudoroseomonas aestuarii]
MLSLGGGAVVYLPHWLGQYYDGPNAGRGQEAPRLVLSADAAPTWRTAATGDTPPAPTPLDVAQAPARPTQEQEDVTALQAEISRLLTMASQLDQELALLEAAAEAPEAEMPKEGMPEDKVPRDDVSSPAGRMDAAATGLRGMEEPALPPQASAISGSFPYQLDFARSDDAHFGEHTDHVPLAGPGSEPESGPDPLPVIAPETPVPQSPRAPESSPVDLEVAVSTPAPDEQALPVVPAEQHEKSTEAVESSTDMPASPEAEAVQAPPPEAPQPGENLRDSPDLASSDRPAARDAEPNSAPQAAPGDAPLAAMPQGSQEEAASAPPPAPEVTAEDPGPENRAEPTTPPQAEAVPPGVAERAGPEAARTEAPASQSAAEAAAPARDLASPVAPEAISPSGGPPEASLAAGQEAARPPAEKAGVVAPVPPAPPPPALSAPSLSAEEKAALLKQAEEKLALGDIAAARLLYQQAAQAGSSQAAAALSRTYQPDFLKGLGAEGTPSDPLLALVWARRAEALAKAEPVPEPQLMAPPQPPQAAPAPATAPEPVPGTASASGPEPARAAAPAQAPVATTAPPPRPRPTGSPERLEAVIRRADEMLALRDISAARRLYAYAAEAGSGKAAAALGQTYDPAFLDRIGAQGIRPDPALAVRWYRQAMSLGEAQVAPALSRLERR